MPTRTRGPLAANLCLATCLLLALGIYASPFIAGNSRRVGSVPAVASSVNDSVPSARAATGRLAALAMGKTIQPNSNGASKTTDIAHAQPLAATALDPSLDLIAALMTAEQTDAAEPAQGDSVTVQYLYTPIEDLREGNLVVATDPTTGETRLARVVQTFQRTTYHLRHLDLQDSAGNIQRIETTDEHPFYDAVLHDFVPAGKLRVGDSVRGPLGEILHVVSTRYEELPAGLTVYNLEVESLHTYYISAHGARAPPASVPNAKGCVGLYKDVGGHHIYAKAAFRGNSSYNMRRALCISQDCMDSRGWDHNAMSTAQQRLFRELAASGRPNTLKEHTRIAIEALIAGGARRKEAKALVQQALGNLRGMGVSRPSHIPWN